MEIEREEGSENSRDSGSLADPTPATPIRELMEWSPARLFLEVLMGAGGGALLALALPGEEAGLALFAGMGAVAAPTALLLTPRKGGPAYRAFRYGLALSVVVTLVASFLAGAETLSLEELLAFGMILFAVGWLGHGALAVTVDRMRGTEATGARESGEG